MNTDNIALVDLDGTAADYDGEMQRREALLRAPGELPCHDYDAPPHIEARRSLIKSQPGFWRNLPVHPPGFEVIELLRFIGFKLHVLTKGPKKTTSAWTEKLEWCQKHIPDADVTVTLNKSLVYGRVLVDDFPPYFEPWLLTRPRGLVICVAQEWNAAFNKGGLKEHPNVIRYDGTNLKQVEAALVRAFSRSPGGRAPDFKSEVLTSEA